MIAAGMTQASVAAGADGVIPSARAALDAALTSPSGDSTMPTAATPELSLAHGGMGGPYARRARGLRKSL